ncbi:hypothetical protein SAY86_002155 [Trapa natans]|uniref:Uncharacterized protein n=1 Tax=Trapa natans TaxID=22666 RepID=A0AAN7LRW6_TRANT|nr:hypothetical protein SAY86_002155 [Trapa natans]
MLGGSIVGSFRVPMEKCQPTSLQVTKADDDQTSPSSQIIGDCPRAPVDRNNSIQHKKMVKGEEQSQAGNK